MNKADRKDLYDLGKILGSTNDEEEIQAALVAMKEILKEKAIIEEIYVHLGQILFSKNKEEIHFSLKAIKKFLAMNQR